MLSSVTSKPSFLSLIRTAVSAVDTLKKTPIHDLHLALKGQMVPFAGYEMPVQYKDGVKAETLHTRKHASLFDVSHMGQLIFAGKDRRKFLESITPISLSSTKPGHAKLTCLTTSKGTIVDDLMVTNHPDHIYAVVNAACKEKDIELFDSAIKQNSNLDVHYCELDRALFALQGPAASTVLQKHIDYDLNTQSFMTQKEGIFVTSCGVEVPVLISRSSYCGTDGFEISVPKEHAVNVAACLLGHEEVKPAGLGSRDTLRLEAGLCLYGNEMSDGTTVPEAGLSWLVTKKRRSEGGFVGDSIINKQIINGVERLRVGLLINGAPAREHSTICDLNGNTIGEVTSGSFSPHLNKPIAMGYVPTSFSKIGTKLKVLVRGRPVDAEVVKTPFVPTTYYRG
ncbi:hypothetical protein RCL1_007739 [Eukaryota sp. TZLM3-RCL]